MVAGKLNEVEELLHTAEVDVNYKDFVSKIKFFLLYIWLHNAIFSIIIQNECIRTYYFLFLFLKPVSWSSMERPRSTTLLSRAMQLSVPFSSRKELFLKRYFADRYIGNSFLDKCCCNI